MAENEAPQSACCLGHDPATGTPLLGVSLLNPSPTSRPLPELLPFIKGETLPEVIADAHPYAFNMGGGRVIQNYEDAAEALMERYMPEVLHDYQKEAIFVPETHMPTRPRAVDLQRLESRKRKVDEMGQEALKLVGMKRSKDGKPEEIDHVKGDLTEKELVVELKKFFASATEKGVVVLHGPWIRKPREVKAYYQEKDVLIVKKKTKTVYNIECKTRLAKRPGNNAIEQIQKTKKALEEFFATDLAYKDWCFVGMIYTNSFNQKTPSALIALGSS